MKFVPFVSTVLSFRPVFFRVVATFRLFPVVMIAAAVQADTLTVTNLDDSGPGSLRATLAAATSGDTIVFAENLEGTLTLTSGEIALNKTVTVQGPGAKRLTITSNLQSRAFSLNAPADVSLADLTLAGCSTPTGNGGAISNVNGTLKLDRCVVRDSSAFSGGAILVTGENGSATLKLTNSTVTGNTARAAGGGIFNAAFFNGTTNVTLVNCTLSNNAASSTATGNFPDGGAILNQGYGGQATMKVVHSTLAGNYVSSRYSSYFADTIANRAEFPGHVTMEMGHCILQSDGLFKALTNSGQVTFTSLGYNLCSDEADGDMFAGPGGRFNAIGDRRNTDAQLHGLLDQGGPTPVHLLGGHSPARDAGDPAFAPATFSPPLTNDQRGPGYARVLKGVYDAGPAVIDIGALECLVPPVLVTLPPNGLNNILTDDPYDLAAAAGAQPPGGVFSGPGVANGKFDPSVAGFGQHVITYTVSEGSSTAETQFVITVHSPPVANPDRVLYTGNEEPVEINVLSNDTDPDGDPLTVTAVTQGEYGTVSIANSGLYIFYQPVGKPKSDRFTYTITDRRGAMATASVEVGEFYDAASGSYCGLVQANTTVTPTEAKRGYIQLTVNRVNGRFTGYLKTSQFRKNFSGAFNHWGVARFGRSGEMTLLLPRKNLPALAFSASLAIDTGEVERVTGALTENGTPFAVFTADRMIYTASSKGEPPLGTVPAALLGRYTVVFAPKTPVEQGLPAGDFPPGHGVGLLTVQKSGLVRLSATLADGTAVSAANPLVTGDAWPLYAPLPNGRGSISGLVTFRDVPGVSDIDGVD
jgi:hypothetical protein